MGSIVILTGAGVSAESGLGTFRDQDGLWTQFDLSEVATPEGYAADPAKVLDFYNARRRNCVAAAHNAAHQALAKLQRGWTGDVLLVTQNIDDLHERAGSTEVVHMHGEILKALCASCGHRWAWAGDMTVRDGCPSCSAMGTVRPDIVWFGEVPYQMERIYDALAVCDRFVSIGTSGSVYPAAGFVAEARQYGAQCIEINLEASDTSEMFHRHILGPATETVPAWVAEVVGSRGKLP